MKTQKIITSLAILGILVMPVAALAVDFTVPGQMSPDLPTVINNILTPIWQVFIGLAVIMIIVAGILFLVAGGSAEKVATARQALIWGVIGIVVGVLAFSITTIVRMAFVR